MTEMAQFALRWILMFDAVTCAIPGARVSAQVGQNASASRTFPRFSDETMAAVREIYERRIQAVGSSILVAKDGFRNHARRGDEVSTGSGSDQVSGIGRLSARPGRYRSGTDLRPDVEK